MTRALILGGTSDASLLAAAIARAGIDAVYSYGGRTRAPADQPLPTRI
ncbi:precorrin-6A/cobalt-precorrin-6A reductase, partial [Bradyrhizobium sp. SHOUNA76]